MSWLKMNFKNIVWIIKAISYFVLLRSFGIIIIVVVIIIIIIVIIIIILSKDLFFYIYIQITFSHSFWLENDDE